MSQQLKHMLTDRQLVDLVLGGDLHAFGTIVGITESLVAQIVFKLIPNEEDRRDVAQDIYVKVYQHLENFRFQAKLSTWIAQIAYNTCLNRLQKKQLPVYHPPEREAGESGEETPEDRWRATDETDRLLLQKELKELLQAEIGKLPPIYQTLIGLYHQEELTYHEIARITGLPEGTVKSYLFRARRQLKDTMLYIYKKEKL